ncbi:MAG: NAD(P)H-binding protein [Pseudomonadales bacterium]|nr:NAD(P)H-binding protein [Pseudomonadales bacterium]
MSVHLTSSAIHIRGPVLISGANGSLGRRMIARLAPLVSVVALVRSALAAKGLQSELAASNFAANVTIHVHDYSQGAGATGLVEIMTGCKSLIHLAGIIKETRSSTYIQAQEDTTRALVEAAERCSVERIIYVSILGADVGSTNACLSSRGRAEHILLDSDISSLILRVPMVLGQGDYATVALQRRAAARLVFLLRGRSLEQPIFAGDLENALLAGLKHNMSEHKVLELAGPESLSRAQLITRAAQIMHQSASGSSILPTLISLPVVLGYGLAWLLENVLASPPLTRAMLGVLDHDDNIDPVPACDWLGIELTPLDAMLKTLLQ